MHLVHENRNFQRSRYQLILTFEAAVYDATDWTSNGDAVEALETSVET